MSNRHLKSRFLVGVATGALLFAAGAKPATAGPMHAEEQAAETPAPAPCPACATAEAAAVNNGNLSLTLQNDFTTAYYFRGILQENDDMIWEPSIGIGLKLYSSEDGVLRTASVGVGTWESVHSDHTGSSGGGPNAWYEADIYPSMTLTWAGGLTTGVTYYWYTSPNNAFNTTEEVDVNLGFDDSPYLDKFALHPSLTLAFETKGSSFQEFVSGGTRGHGKGSVAIIGLAPSYAFGFMGDDYPLTVTMPISVALSMDSYYRDATHDDTFGYASIGLNANIPLAFIPKTYGTWSVTNGINVLFLSKALEDVNSSSLACTQPGCDVDAAADGHDVVPVWTSSIILSY